MWSVFSEVESFGSQHFGLSLDACPAFFCFTEGRQHQGKDYYQEPCSFESEVMLDSRGDPGREPPLKPIKESFGSQQFGFILYACPALSRLRRAGCSRGYYSVDRKCVKMVPVREELKDKAKQAREILGSRLSDPPTVAELARLCMTNHRALQIAFKAVFSKSINEVSVELRMNRAKWLLVNTEYTLDEIAEETEYHDRASLCKYFKKHVGMTPGLYRESEDKEI